MKLFALAALTLLASTLASASAFAGAANAELDCRAKSGLTVKGSIPGDFADFDITVAKKGASSHLYSGYDSAQNAEVSNARLNVVDHYDVAVWTLTASLNQGYGIIEMYAIPKTYRVKKQQYGFHSRFTAKGMVNLPELGGQTSEETFECSLDYSL